MSERIRPYSKNPWYWEMGGKPVLLLGGSVEDNLFQIPDLAAHLDRLQSCGGNYVRCTMSSRDPGDVWPFGRPAAGAPYDLDRWNDAYWRRFASLLSLCEKRGIVVQIEVWDRFDFARAPWRDNPFNPAVNRNYDARTSGLPPEITSHPGRRENRFFRTVPALENNTVVLKYQHKFVDKLLDASLRFPHVLYCMDNETNESPRWPAYWADFIRERAAKEGVTVQTTEMWDAHDLGDAMHRNTFDDPQRYTFVDVSQNNHQSGQAHYDNALAARARLAGTPRPMNCVKTYGADTGSYGSDTDGQERFWRSIFAGCAGARFHRPPSGLGLGPVAQTNLRACRLLTDALEIFDCVPQPNALDGAGGNSAYCLAGPGKWALYLPRGGQITLRTGDAKGPLRVRRLDIAAARWAEEEEAHGAAGALALRFPGDRPAAALVRRA